MKFVAAFGMAFNILGMIGGGFLLGFWADSYFGTTPLWMIIGTVGGAVSALTWLIRLGSGPYDR